MIVFIGNYTDVNMVVKKKRKAAGNKGVKRKTRGQPADKKAFSLQDYPQTVVDVDIDQDLNIKWYVIGGFYPYEPPL